jgi:cystathionine beta-synthase
MDGDRLVGVITEDDIIRLAFGRPALMAEPVRIAMRTRFLKVDKETSLDNLVALLHGDSYAAVTEQGGERFLGLITRSDVLNYLRRLHQKETQ